MAPFKYEVRDKFYVYSALTLFFNRIRIERSSTSIQSQYIFFINIKENDLLPGFTPLKLCLHRRLIETTIIACFSPSIPSYLILLMEGGCLS